MHRRRIYSTRAVRSLWCPVHTADAESPTRRNCQVASRRRCEHTRRQSWPSLQFPVLTSDDIGLIMSLLKSYKNSRIKFTYKNSRKLHAACSVWRFRRQTSIFMETIRVPVSSNCVHIVESVGTGQSSWASCEFMYTPPTRRNSAVSSRRLCRDVSCVMLGAVCDENCASGCATQGEGKCDSQCNINYKLVSYYCEGK